METKASFKVMLLITLFGKYLVYWRDKESSQTTSSHNFLPLISRIGLEQKSISHSEMLWWSISGSRYTNSAVGSSSSSSASNVDEMEEASEIEHDGEWTDLSLVLGNFASDWKGNSVKEVKFEMGLWVWSKGCLILEGLNLRAAMTAKFSSSNERNCRKMNEMLSLPLIFWHCAGRQIKWN